MAVVIETTLGDFTVDLFAEDRPQTCKNFLKLCKIKYYNFCLFHSVQANFLAQTGDPTGSGTGGESVFGLVFGEDARYYEAEKLPKIKHTKPGLLSMVNCGDNMLGSQFFITLGCDLQSLDEHCVFAEITEGMEILLKLNETICDNQHRPYKDIRITHTVILEDPFEDISGLVIPENSPEINRLSLANGRIGADEEVDEMAGLTSAEVEEMKQEREAKARATILEIVGDLPDAEMAPPENVLFVCKLNPVTNDDDLEIIFSRFGKVKSCEVIRDHETGDSLQYAFVEFEDKKACEDAYFKMDNVLIDDRRIHVDFSQSVAKMRWRGKGRGVEYFDKESDKGNERLRRTNDSRRELDQGRESNYRKRQDEERYMRREENGDPRRRDWKKDGDCRKSDDRRRPEPSNKPEYSGGSRYSSKKPREETRPEDTFRRAQPSESEKKARDDRRYHSYHNNYNQRREEASKSREDQRKRENYYKEERIILKNETPNSQDSNKGRLKEENKPQHRLQSKEQVKDKKYENPRIEKLKENGYNENRVGSKQGSREKDYPSPSTIAGKKEPSKDDNFNNEDNQSIAGSSNRNDNSIIDPSNTSSHSPDISSKVDDKVKDKKLKRKQKLADSKPKKKKKHSSSSESESSASSDSSNSSSSSDSVSSDYKHKPKVKTTVAKKYYHKGKLVKIVKKKQDSTDSESDSDDSSDSDRRKKKQKKKGRSKKIVIIKKRRRKDYDSSDDSDSNSSSSNDSEEEKIKKKKKRKTLEKKRKKKKRISSGKKHKKSREESSESEDDDESEVPHKKLKK